MKFPILALCTVLFATSCSSTKNNTGNLPKDISERPADENSQMYEAAQLDKIKASIETEIAKEKCNDASQWTFAPMGSKACGGPQLYIAYPKKSETVILQKINDYTEKVKAFNEKYKVMSDCMMIIPPSSIKCVDGKAELVNS